MGKKIRNHGNMIADFLIKFFGWLWQMTYLSKHLAAESCVFKYDAADDGRGLGACDVSAGIECAYAIAASYNARLV